jgi:hypothetical protein
MFHFRQLVNDNEDHIVVVCGYWEGSEIVYADAPPGPCRDQQRLKFAAMVFVDVCLPVGYVWKT